MDDKPLSIDRVFGDDPSKFNLNTLAGAFDPVTNIMFGLAGSLALIFLIWGGLQYLTAGGNTDQTGKAKATITWAVIGLLVIILAYAIVNYFARVVITNPPIAGS